MKYLKRLKNELLDLTEKLTPKGDKPEYVSARKTNRSHVLVVLIEMIRKVRALDEATDNWSQENADEWVTFLDKVSTWLTSMPTPPEAVERSKSAAE